MCPEHIRPELVRCCKDSIEFNNGSRIISSAASANLGRGMTISLLVLDEYAFVKPSIADEFIKSVMPALLSESKVIITSTPNSDKDTFAAIWKGSQDTIDEFGNERIDGLGENGFFGFKVNWQEHPLRNEAWRVSEEGNIGTERFSREYELSSIAT